MEVTNSRNLSGTKQQKLSRSLSLLFTYKPMFTKCITNPSLLLEISGKKSFFFLEILVIFFVFYAVTQISIDKPHVTMHQPPRKDGHTTLCRCKQLNREKKPSSWKYPSSSDVDRQENSLCLRPQCVLVGTELSGSSIIT